MSPKLALWAALLLAPQVNLVAAQGTACESPSGWTASPSGQTLIPFPTIEFRFSSSGLLPVCLPAASTMYLDDREVSHTVTVEGTDLVLRHQSGILSPGTHRAIVWVDPYGHAQTTFDIVIQASDWGDYQRVDVLNTGRLQVAPAHAGSTPGVTTPTVPGTPGVATPDIPGTPGHPIADLPGIPGQHVANVPGTPPVQTPDVPPVEPVETPDVPASGPIVTPPVQKHVADVTVYDRDQFLCVGITPAGSQNVELACVLRAVPASLVPRGTTPIVVTYDAPDHGGTSPMAVPDVPGRPGVDVLDVPAQPSRTLSTPPVGPIATPDVPPTSPTSVQDVPGTPPREVDDAEPMPYRTPRMEIEADVSYTYDRLRMREVATVLGRIHVNHPLGYVGSFATNGDDMSLDIRVTVYEDGSDIYSLNLGIPWMGQLLAAAQVDG